MLLSILIPTLAAREGHFLSLLGRLNRQIVEARFGGDVEVLYFIDQGEESVGRKRNALLDRARGKFVCFVDDDDDVDDEFLTTICNALRSHAHVDCMGLTGLLMVSGMAPRLFIHSIEYAEYFEDADADYRPPNHLNPIRRSIASQYRFADRSFGEDREWALRIAADGVLRKQVHVPKVLYYYRFDPANSATKRYDVGVAVPH